MAEVHVRSEGEATDDAPPERPMGRHILTPYRPRRGGTRFRLAVGGRGPEAWVLRGRALKRFETSHLRIPCRASGRGPFGRRRSGLISAALRCRPLTYIHSVALTGRKPMSNSGDCRHCGAQFKRRRKTAIYCSSQCAEKLNTLRAIRRRSSRIPGSAPPGNIGLRAGRPECRSVFQLS
jgi:hypothetical protein